MKKRTLGNILGFALVTGTIAVMVRLFEYLGNQGKEYFLADFKELVKKQKTVDELNAREITEWIRESKKGVFEELTFILAYPTREIIEKYRLKGFPDNMDKEHNMIFLAVRKNDYTPMKIQLVSFGTIDSRIAAELFQGEDYAVVEE